MKGKKLITLMRSGVLGMSKPVMIGVVVVCLILAVVIFFFSGGDDQGAYETLEGNMIWVKCNNPQCKAEYQMSERAYHKSVQERMDPRSLATPALICEQCGKPSVYKAYKCINPDCGIVFFAGSVPNDFEDRCPECGWSETEKIRERRKAGGQ